MLQVLTRVAQLPAVHCAAQDNMFWFWRVAQLWSRALRRSG
ncbi:hypothetical protein A2U01_0113427, partial [Trifolium medium]|nr:hypothetical protein [Trifolium medium]